MILLIRLSVFRWCVVRLSVFVVFGVFVVFFYRIDV